MLDIVQAAVEIFYSVVQRQVTPLCVLFFFFTVNLGFSIKSNSRLWETSSGRLTIMYMSSIILILTCIFGGSLYLVLNTDHISYADYVFLRDGLSYSISMFCFLGCVLVRTVAETVINRSKAKHNRDR